MISEPTFVASRDGLCGFVLVVEDGQVDAYTPSGNLLGVFRDRIEAVEAVVQNAALCARGDLNNRRRHDELFHLACS
jgi:hypothetical protein